MLEANESVDPERFIDPASFVFASSLPSFPASRRPMRLAHQASSSMVSARASLRVFRTMHPRSAMVISFLISSLSA